MKSITETFTKTGIAQVIETKEGPNYLKVMHRVPVSQQRSWLDRMENVFGAEKDWSCHLSKDYFFRSGRMRYAWVFILQWKSSKKEAVEQLEKLLLGDVNSGLRHQLKSYPLIGAASDRNIPEGKHNPRAPGPRSGGPSQKGAHKIGGN
jgi:hypothetical protein